MDLKLSPHFYLSEFVASGIAERFGIDNTPPQNVIGNLRMLALALEDVRALLARPMRISSGYRCRELNMTVGGSENSQHMFGYAADFIVPGVEARAVCLAIEASPLLFDQLIFEYAWTHISFVPNDARRSVLTFHGDGYSRGIL